MNIESLRKQFIESSIIGLEKKIFVLKGYEFFHDISLPKLFDSTKSVQEIIIDLNYNLNNKDETFYIHFSDLFILDSMQILGLLSITDRFQLLDFNLFQGYYFSNETVDAKFIINEYESNTESILQRQFGVLDYLDNIAGVIYKYNEINLSSIKFTEHLFQKTNQELSITDIPQSNLNVANVKDVEILTFNFTPNQIISYFLSLNDNEISYFSFDGNIENNTISKMIVSLYLIGYKIELVSSFTEQEKFLDDKFLPYLKRINPSYEFKNLLVYKNPSIYDNETTQISQVQIINEIYENVLKNQKGALSYDTIVTAPTGAGKSVIFQIPAVKLAEEHGLFTLIISPLIGLMKDQVENIKKLTNLAATINSEYTPHEKEEIKKNIREGKTSILYVSPETVLANSDISAIIGDRKLGLVVVDEAHAVSTWGKNFRPDYWFLGDHLKRIKKLGNHNFTIAAFTATAVYGGEDDMFYDIVNSLGLKYKNPYLGKVVRSDISFDINVKESSNYRVDKNRLTLERIKNNINNNVKTLIYFPYIKQLNDIYEKLSSDRDKVCRYYGNLDKQEKDLSLEDYRDSTRIIMLATKAFGMGIDINDIKEVYHYAPTGNLADYVQEIGRAARTPSIHGVAATDFFNEDFNYIKQLFGMSAIRDFELRSTVSKILQVYQSKGGRRNLTISPEQFSFIFTNCSTLDELDVRLKTVLLSIKNDLQITEGLFNYALIIKPQAMYTKGLFMILDKNKVVFQKNGWLEKYLTIRFTREDIKNKIGNTTVSYTGDIYQFDFKKMWEEEYSDYSFGQFKLLFMKNKLPENPKDDSKLLFHTNLLVSYIVMKARSKKDSFSTICQLMIEIINKFIDILDEIHKVNKFFTIDELSCLSKGIFSGASSNQTSLIVQGLLNLIDDMDNNSIHSRPSFLSYSIDGNKVFIKNNSYKSKSDKLKRIVISSFRNKKTKDLIIVTPNPNRELNVLKNEAVIAIQLFELFMYGEVEISTGEAPEYFFRINSEISLNKIADSNYKSKTLGIIKKQHYNSVKCMNHFFKNISTDQERWNYIEEYFLGRNVIPEEEMILNEDSTALITS